MNKKKVSVFEIILLLLCLMLCIGVKLVFHSCAVMEGESIMACHWAEQAVFCNGIALAAMSLFLVISGNAGTKRGLALSLLILSVLTAAIPGGFIRLCMMDGMRCRAVMRPSVVILSALIAVVSVICLVKNRSDEK